MDIKSGCGYPASSLSNFAPHPFIIDGIECNSMEGFLQSLKFPNPDVQKEVCKLVGYAAKKRGKSGDSWKKTQTLYWNGVEYPRKSNGYQQLLDAAYFALSKNTKFRAALMATGNAVIKHSIGKSKKADTVLTKAEFCGRLTQLRDDYNLKLRNVERHYPVGGNYPELP